MDIAHPGQICLVTDFPDADGKPQRQHFRAPTECILAWRASDVLPALRRIDEASRWGVWAVGYLAYEAAAGLDAKLAQSMHILPDTVHARPLLAFGLFDGPCMLPTADGSLPAPSAHTPAPEWTLSENADTYTRQVEHIRQDIAAGEVYQVNYTLRAHSREDGALSLWHYYEALRQRQQADYCAWLDWGNWQVLSLSPELFFDWHRHTGRIVTRPMKGTAPRGTTPEQDSAAAQALQTSPKERAENVMIVDLLRNDLGRIAETGSVQVPALFATEPYPTLWQMTSTVRAQLPHETDLATVLQALFPCGSITGAPKRKSMEKIAALESGPRDVYCGALGIVSPDRAVFNVAIRTVAAWPQQPLEAGFGSGITWSSQAQAEYAECALKSQFLRTPPLPAPDWSLLETLLLSEGRYALLPLHLQRLEASAQAWNFRPMPPTRSRRALQDYAATHAQGCWRVRLLLAADGALSVQGTALPQTPSTQWMEDPNIGWIPGEWMHAPDQDFSLQEQNVYIEISPNPTTELPWLQHKTSQRHYYDQVLAQHPQAWDVLLHNAQGHATECTRGNIVLQSGGQWLTPPLSDGLLAGTLRTALLQRGLVQEASLPLDRLLQPQSGDRLWFINSVRGWVPLSIAGF